MIKNIDKNIFSLRSEFSVSAIHDISLRILKEIGISIPSVNALDILHKMGCKVDRSQKKAFIPEDVVADALNKVVSQYELFDRSGEKSVVIGGNNVAFMSGAAAIRVKDLDGTYRPSTLKDLADMTRLQDSLDNLDVLHEIVEALDVDPATFRVDMAAEMLKNTTKPCAFVVEGPQDVEDFYAMGIAIRKSKQALLEKPLFTIHDISAESTLGIVKDGCDAMIRCAELGIPTGLAAYPIMGMTGPVTVEGALALANANVLAALVIVQHINPGHPFLYMIMAGSTDMRNAEMVTAGPEICQYYMAGQKMAEYYGMPSQCIVSCDAKLSDSQMALEKLSGIMVSALSGINLIHGATCEMDGMNLASFEQILIDDEIISMIKHMAGGFSLSRYDLDYDLVFEEIKQSIENPLYFMDSDITLDKHADTLWMSNLFARKNFANWTDTGMKSIIDNSNEKVRELLSSYEVEPLDVEVEKEIISIVEKSKKRS